MENTPMQTTNTDTDKLVDQLGDLKIDLPEDLSPEEREYAQVIQAMEIRNLINSFVRTRKFSLNKILAILPMDEEDAKIILARLSECTEDEIAGFSDEEVKKILTINEEDGPVGNFFIPEVEIEGFNMQTFERDMLTLFAATKQQLDDIDAMINRLQEQYDEYIPEEITAIINSSTFDEYILKFYRHQLTEEKLMDEKRAIIETNIKAMEDAVTLEPLSEPIINLLNTKGNESILHGYHKQMEDTIAKATEKAEKNNFQFPFQLMMDLEVNTFGEEYKPYNNLFVFLFARFLKHQPDTMDRYTIQFCRALSTSLVNIVRRGENVSDEYIANHTKYIKELVDFVINAE